MRNGKTNQSPLRAALKIATHILVLLNLTWWLFDSLEFNNKKRSARLKLAVTFELTNGLNQMESPANVYSNKIDPIFLQEGNVVYAELDLKAPAESGPTVSGGSAVRMTKEETTEYAEIVPIQQPASPNKPAEWRAK